MMKPRAPSTCMIHIPTGLAGMAPGMEVMVHGRVGMDPGAAVMAPGQADLMVHGVAVMGPGQVELMEHGLVAMVPGLAVTVPGLVVTARGAADIAPGAVDMVPGAALSPGRVRSLWIQLLFPVSWLVQHRMLRFPRQPLPSSCRIHKQIQVLIIQKPPAFKWLGAFFYRS